MDVASSWVIMKCDIGIVQESLPKHNNIDHVILVFVVIIIGRIIVTHLANWNALWTIGRDN